MAEPRRTTNSHQSQRESFVDAEEAAGFLRIAPRTLLAMARAGEVPAHPITTGARKLWRFKISELDERFCCQVHCPDSRPCHDKKEES
jgi:hypothetical protein